MTITAAKWTIADYHQMLAAGILNNRAVELLNGEIIEMAPEAEPHAYYGHTAAKYLDRLLDDRAEVRQGHPITIPASNSEPEPDVAIVQPLGREYLNHHPYPENIFGVIEYSDSSLAKDLECKAKVYATANISEYWIVNLKAMALIVLRDPIEGEYRSQISFTQGTISPIAFADLAIPINRLLEDRDSEAIAIHRSIDPEQPSAAANR